ncbi:HAT family dimerization domain-containing protein, partial [Trifolium pratense]
AVEYPILSQLVRDIMPTPVSTVASESAFSTGGRVLEVYRSSLKPDMAEALICTQNWLRPSFYQFKAIKFDEECEICEDALNGLVGSSVASGQPSSQSQSQPSGCV